MLGMLRRVLPILLMKELTMTIERLMVSLQMCFLISICSSLTPSPSPLLDANPESGLIPGATNDQESSQGAHQAADDEEHEDVSQSHPIDGKN